MQSFQDGLPMSKIEKLNLPETNMTDKLMKEFDKGADEVRITQPAKEYTDASNRAVMGKLEELDQKLNKIFARHIDKKRGQE